MLKNIIKNNKDYSREISWLLEEKYHSKYHGKYHEIVNEETKSDILRIEEGEPVAYVIGYVNFLGLKIDLSQRTLIPRAETEFWLEQAIKDIKRHQDASIEVKCLDIFAGSGCIGVAILKNIQSTTVDFVDCDTKAIKQIAINCKLNDINSYRYHVIESDLFENVSGSYDYIFANPPYIAKERKDVMQKSVLVYEPHTALFGGNDGLLYIRTFLNKAKNYLNNNGKIYMEFDSHQKNEIEKIMLDIDFGGFSFFKDQFGEWRFLVVEK
jgi:release factor glutamine methyltransferase